MTLFNRGNCSLKDSSPPTRGMGGVGVEGGLEWLVVGTCLKKLSFFQNHVLALGEGWKLPDPECIYHQRHYRCQADR